MWVPPSCPCDIHLSDFPAALATLFSPSLPYSLFSTQQHRAPLKTPPSQPSSGPHLWQQPATLHNLASRDLCPELPSSHLEGPSSMRGSVPPSGLPSSPDISMAGRSRFFHSGSSQRARLGSVYSLMNALPEHIAQGRRQILQSKTELSVLGPGPYVTSSGPLERAFQELQFLRGYSRDHRVRLAR